MIHSTLYWLAPYLTHKTATDYWKQEQPVSYNFIMQTSLCKTSDITDPGSKGFELENDGQPVNVFVVHKDGNFYAYINSCPHTGVMLEWLENEFLDIENNFIQCSTHGALFEINSGHCVAGPCAGDHLTPIKHHIRDNDLYIDLP